MGRPLTCNEYFFLILCIVVYHDTDKIVLLTTSQLYDRYFVLF